MNQMILSVCALALAAGCTCSGQTCCSRPNPCSQPDPCPKPLKVKISCCYDAYREPYRISYPRLCPRVGEFVEVGNTQGALAMRRQAILRQREIVCFEKGLLAAVTDTQPATGTTMFGATDGAGVVDNPCTPVPPAPPYPGPQYAPRSVRMLSPVGEEIPVALPVPGKPGYVYCPFGTTRSYVDIRGLAPGSLARDPYSGQTFRVP